MFEDIDDGKSEIVISRDGSDRSIVYAIWSRSVKSRLTTAAAWAVLHERYRTDARFLLLSTYAELVGERAASWSASDFIATAQRILDAAGGRLNPEVRDLLAIAEDDLHSLTDDDTSRLDRIRGRVGARVGHGEAAKKRLARLASDVVRELHERTLGGKPIAAGGGDTEWKTAVAGASGEKKPYSATEKVTRGDLVEHPKFGVGVVTAVEPGRAQILFESGARKLVCG